MNLIDKELIKQEIERRIKQLPEETEHKPLKAVYGGIAYELIKLLRFIDSLPEEPASEDLEEAANEFGIRQGVELKPFAIKFFTAGAEWQKQQMKEVLQTEYEKGRFDMREEIMKMAEDTAGLSLSWGKDSKTKIIIIEEEQQ